MTAFASASFIAMGKYAESEEWSDVVPIAQDDGGPNPLAAIAYTESYSDAMAYLRAVMANDEKSERVLELTEDIISMNPAHYTVWFVPAIRLRYWPVNAHIEITGYTEQASSSHSIQISSKSFNGSTTSPSNISKTIRFGNTPLRPLQFES